MPTVQLRHTGKGGAGRGVDHAARLGLAEPNGRGRWRSSLTSTTPSTRGSGSPTQMYIVTALFGASERYRANASSTVVNWGNARTFFRSIGPVPLACEARAGGPGPSWSPAGDGAGREATGVPRDGFRVSLSPLGGRPPWGGAFEVPSLKTGRSDGKVRGRVFPREEVLHRVESRRSGAPSARERTPGRILAKVDDETDDAHVLRPILGVLAALEPTSAMLLEARPDGFARASRFRSRASLT